MSEYQPGQRWTYRSRKHDVGSTLLIGKVEKRFLQQPIVHVTVHSVKPNVYAEAVDINHMPLTVSALDESVLEQIESNVAISSQFHEGLNHWQANKGGVFDIPVAEAVDGVFSVIAQTGDDPFDAIVAKMRAKQSKAMISDLYRLLFSIDEWYFLCDPNNRRTPVEWIFPDGPNPTPAILAFTSRERAVSAAITLGIYPKDSAVSVKPAKVKEAVAWISEPGCTYTWICFNLTYQDFPLYCDQAAKLMALIVNA